MKTNKLFINILFCLVISMGVVSVNSWAGQTPDEFFNLKEAIEKAIHENLELKSSKKAWEAAMAEKNARRADFFPTVSLRYLYKHNYEKNSLSGTSIPSGVFTIPQDEYSLVTSLNQPLFTGFAILNNYQIADLGFDAAKIREKLTRRKIIFQVKKFYFSFLKAKKILDVSREAVKQLSDHYKVAQHFYQVGMIPLNDLLKVKVELANTKQEFIVAQNNLKIAESNFNLILRRPINSTVYLEDILDYTPFKNDIDYCINETEKNRLEIKIADLEVKINDKKSKLAQKDFFPSVNLQANYYKLGADPDLHGGEGISDPDSWDIQTVLSWNIWEWGKSYYRVKAENNRLEESINKKEEIYDQVRFEVKQAFLKTMESEKNIETMKQAIKQAEENFRINEERYREQMATSTDVLDARTLLSKTMTNYYNALYDFKIAKAALYRAMGHEVY